MSIPVRLSAFPACGRGASGVAEGGPRQRSGSPTGHVWYGEKGPALRLARKNFPHGRSRLSSEGPERQRRTCGSRLTAVGDRARGERRSERSEGLQGLATTLTNGGESPANRPICGPRGRALVTRAAGAPGSLPASFFPRGSAAQSATRPACRPDIVRAVIGTPTCPAPAGARRGPGRAGCRAARGRARPSWTSRRTSRDAASGWPGRLPPERHTKNGPASAEASRPVDATSARAR